MILSDSSIPAVPGGYGGSQGYAAEGTVGFAGGWLGVALDEYGNYANPTEGRPDGPGFTTEEVGMRGRERHQWIRLDWRLGQPGRRGVDNHSSIAPSWGYKYQVIIDARNEIGGTVNVAVNRDKTTMNGSNYNSVVPSTNVYGFAQSAVTNGWLPKIVPNYWQISFTSSTGGSTNIHEIGNFRVCAQTVYPTTGQTASGFSAIDNAYSSAATPAYPNFQTGHIYMKLAAKQFQLWVAALTSTGIATGYSATTNKYVQVNLVPNMAPGQKEPCSVSCTSLCTSQSPVEKPGGTQNLAFTTSSSTPGAVLSGSFTLNSAYQDLIAVMRECTTSACTAYTSTAAACSVDDFSVRPQGETIAWTSGTSPLRAGTDPFTVTATTNVSGYTGTQNISTAAVQAVSPATTTGALTTSTTFPMSVTVSGSSATASGSFIYGDVGPIGLEGWQSTTIGSATVGSAAPPLFYDNTWTAVDSGTQNDCVTGTTSAAYSLTAC